MKTTLKLQRALTALSITGISILALAPAHAADAPKVTAFNYVRAETDVQMKGYIESYNSFGKFDHFRQPYDVDNQVTVSGNRDTLYSVGVFDRGALSVFNDRQSGSFDLEFLRSQDRHPDRREGGNPVCVSGPSDLYGSER